MVGNCSRNSIVVLLIYQISQSQRVAGCTACNAASSSSIVLHCPPTPASTFKSIEAYAGEVSVHQMANHFNSLHFLGRYQESQSKKFVVHPRTIATPFSCVLGDTSQQKICYDRGRKLKGLTGLTWLCSQLTQDRR